LEIDTVADLDQIVAVLPAEAQEAVLSTNWLNFFVFSTANRGMIR